MAEALSFTARRGELLFSHDGFDCRIKTLAWRTREGTVYYPVQSGLGDIFVCAAKQSMMTLRRMSTEKYHADKLHACSNSHDVRHSFRQE